jgi:hypothetical protein
VTGVNVALAKAREMGWTEEEQRALTVVMRTAQRLPLRGIYLEPVIIRRSDGDVLCTRLSPRAQCQWLDGHYGGCATA